MSYDLLDLDTFTPEKGKIQRGIIADKNRKLLRQLMVNNGLSCQDVAGILKVSIHTIYHWRSKTARGQITNKKLKRLGVRG